MYVPRQIFILPLAALCLKYRGAKVSGCHWTMMERILSGDRQTTCMNGTISIDTWTQTKPITASMVNLSEITLDMFNFTQQLESKSAMSIESSDMTCVASHAAPVFPQFSQDLVVSVDETVAAQGGAPFPRPEQFDTPHQPMEIISNTAITPPSSPDTATSNDCNIAGSYASLGTYPALCVGDAIQNSSNIQNLYMLAVTVRFWLIPRTRTSVN